MTQRARVFVLYAGGTIGMLPGDPRDPGSALVPASGDGLKPYLGEATELGIEWKMGGPVSADGAQVPPGESSNFGWRQWTEMARAIENVYADFDGFVVLHGTDTLAYTSSALSFLLGDLDKPVVVTGAQKPIFAPGSDGAANLQNALAIAGYKATGLPVVPEVTVCFGSVLLRGNRATKVSTSSFDGFASPHLATLGKLGDGIAIDDKGVLPVATKSLRLRESDKRAPDVRVVTLYPGIEASHIEPLLAAPGLQGLVLRTFGAGNAPTDTAFLNVIGRCVDRGVAVVDVSQCLQGTVQMGLYNASVGLADRGVIGGGELTTEAAFAKLSWILSEKTDGGSVAGNDTSTEFRQERRGEGRCG